MKLLICLISLMSIACSSGRTDRPTFEEKPPASSVDLSREYPNVEALWSSDLGIYRGCGPNNGVCHNGREFPNMKTLGAFLDNIGRPCNEKRDNPKMIDDPCERTGDLLVVGKSESEIGVIRPLGGTRYRIVLDKPIALDESSGSIVRVDDVKRATLWDLASYGVVLEEDKDSPRPSVIVDLRDVDPTLLTSLADAFSRPGAHADPTSIRLGDPNDNGKFGARLGHGLIVPGHPERSYLIHRLTSDAWGSPMPLANCCYWTKKSLRATWCWIAGLDATGSNKLEPINYATCPPGPVESMQYPEPGPGCDTSKLCPVAVSKPASDATFAGVYESVFRASCAGSGCHVANAGRVGAGFDLGNDPAAGYAAARARVVPGDPMKSELYRRVVPDLCGEGCSLMPRDRAPLDEARRKLLRKWIEDGAKQ